MSLSSEPGILLDTVLDTIARRLNADCCWVQLPGDGERLRLAAFRGLTPEIQAGMAGMGPGHTFGQEILGTGNAVIIPDLNRNGHYDLPFFAGAGFRSLLCVPIMTYRVHGIMGTGYRTRKRFSKDDSNLLAAIAGLTGMALAKCSSPEAPAPPRAAEARPPEAGTYPQTLTPENPAAYGEHQRRMRSFRQAHRPFSSEPA